MSRKVVENTDSVARRRPYSEPALENTVSVEVLSAWPMKCAYAVQEIFKTEADYVLALKDLIQGYRTPLSYHLKADNTGHKIISTLFCNVEDLYNLHRGLLKELKSHEGDPHGFGAVFIEMEPKFRQYSKYCNNYDGAVTCLASLTQGNQEFAVFVSSCQHNLGHMLPLSSQLIKPVQRIMRYHIMLKEVLKHFDRNHHGYQSLCKAHASMMRLGEYLNEFKKRKENAARVLDLQSNTTGWSSKDVKNLSAYGELVIEDACRVGSRGISRQVVVFEKLLLILKKKDVKKYTYKGHVMTSEMHVDQKFCSQNPTMIRVSSVLDSTHMYVLDLGSQRKQLEWLNKLLALIRSFIEQSKRGISKKPLPEPKRRKIDEVNIGEDYVDSPVDISEESKSKSMPHKMKQLKASRILSKKKSHGDVRTLFPEQNNSSAKLKAYTVTREDSELTSHSWPSTQPLSQPQASEEAPANIVVQHLEPVASGGSDTVAVGEAKSRPQSGVKRGLAGSTSMDSLVSLSDLDAGMEIPVSPTRQASGSPHESTGFVRQKPVRRAAIKVKRNKTFAGVTPGSASDIIKQRAREAREASMSPPPFLAGVIANGLDDDSDSLSTSEVSSSLLSDNKSASDVTTDSPMVLEEISVGLVGDLDATPVPEDVVDGEPALVLQHEPRLSPQHEPRLSPQQEPRPSPQRDLSHNVSAIKRPRSSSHDQVGLEGSDVSISVEIISEGESGTGEEAEEDDLELGESCGQAMLKGRVGMPGLLEGEGMVGGGELFDEREGDYQLKDHSGSDWLSLGDAGSADEGFVIVDDSSDTEDEGEDSSDDLERVGEDIVASLLEVVDMEEGLREEDSSYEEPVATDDNQVVPSLETTDILDDDSNPEPRDLSTPPSVSSLQFKNSKSTDRTIDIYGTLPNRKKNAKQHSSTSPLLSPTGGDPFVKGEISKSSLRRSKGFTRLLEFTRRQASLDESEDDLASGSGSSCCDLDVSQSLPLVSKFSLDNIVEDYEHEARTDFSSSAVEVGDVSCSDEMETQSDVAPSVALNDHFTNEARADFSSSAVEVGGVSCSDEMETQSDVAPSVALNDHFTNEARADFSSSAVEVGDVSCSDEMATQSDVAPSVAPNNHSANASADGQTDSAVVDVAKSNVENDNDISKDQDASKLNGFDSVDQNSNTDDVSKRDLDIPEDQQGSATRISTGSHINEDINIMEELEMAEHVVPSITEIPQGNGTLCTSETSGFVVAEEVEVSSENNSEELKSETLENSGLQYSKPNTSIPTGLDSEVLEDVQDIMAQENSTKQTAGENVSGSESQQSESSTEVNVSTDEPHVSSGFVESTLSKLDGELENSSINVLESKHTADSHLKDHSNSDDEVKSSSKNGVTLLPRNLDRPSTSAAESTSSQEDSGFFSNWGRTLWHRVSSLRPSYQAAIVLGAAVVAGVIYNVYFM